uniref:Uncharacterized protein n=1 Tax=Physcomitrium patens TaxID=3218 RepID=A0A2K1KJA2_PHYPA|nr:hypothetical protein PHYPA_007539 [Physcomitrium patens]
MSLTFCKKWSGRGVEGVVRGSVEISAWGNDAGSEVLPRRVNCWLQTISNPPAVPARAPQNFRKDGVHLDYRGLGALRQKLALLNWSGPVSRHGGASLVLLHRLWFRRLQRCYCCPELLCQTLNICTRNEGDLPHLYALTVTLKARLSRLHFRID